MPRYVLLVLLALPPSAWSSVDPSASGRFAVGVTTRTFVDAARGRTLVTEIWYPAAVAGRDAAPLRTGHPLVLVAHGNCGFRTNYEYLTVPLASWGFVVAAPDFPTFNKTDCDNGVPLGDLINDPPRDLSFLRTALHDPAGPPVRGRRAGLVGHSLGGAVVVRAALADASFTAVVALAPLVTGGTGPGFVGLQPRRAVFVMGGSADTTLPFDIFGKPFFDALPAPAYLLEITGGTHSGFTDMDAHLTPEALARQQALTHRYAVAFLARYVNHHRRFRTFLTPEDAAAQGPDAQLTVQPPVKHAIAFLAALGLVVAPAGARATMVRALTLEDLVGRAERVVVGRCLDVHETTDPRTGLPITEVTLAVAETLKGPLATRLVFRQLGDQRRPGPAPGYAVGEDVVLFLGRESASGLTAPIGFEQGRIPITRPGGAAPTATITETAAPALAADARCVRRGRCPVALERLLGAIRGMVTP